MWHKDIPESYRNQIVTGDARELAKAIPADAVDLVLTDPPYPDYYVDEYQYVDGIIDFLQRFTCRQFVFWSAKVDFPLPYTAVHIWDKKVGAGSQYERIYELNGNKEYKVFSHYFINSTVAASFTRDIYTGHPSQKPRQLIVDLLQYARLTSGIVLDPFVGSGTTASICKMLGLDYLAFEIDPATADLARERVRNTQPPLIVPQHEQMTFEMP